MLRTHLPLVVTVLCTMGTYTAAQQPSPPPPPRDASPAAAPAGTARITGRVVAADTGAPIRRAMVSLTPAVPRPDGGPMPGGPGPSRSAGRSTITDDSGSFSFAGLAASRYSITVTPGLTRGRYLPVPHFGSGARTLPKIVEIQQGQHVENLEVPLPRAAVVSGRVVVVLPAERMINMMDPSAEVLQALAKEATRVTVGAEDNRRIELRLVTPEDRQAH